jgi:hypothetical protein
MHRSFKYAAAAGVGVGALEFLYTTNWYQTSQFNNVGGAGGIVFDVAVAGVVAGLVGLAIG